MLNAKTPILVINQLDTLVKLISVVYLFIISLGQLVNSFNGFATPQLMHKARVMCIPLDIRLCVCLCERSSTRDCLGFFFGPFLYQLYMLFVYIENMIYNV